VVVRRGIVLVIPPQTQTEDAERTLRAVRAHVASEGEPLHVERPGAWPPSQQARIREAMGLAARHAARGVLWVEAPEGDDVLLYLVEPEGLRVLLRRIPAPQGERPATFESLGVIVGSVARGLQEGRTIGMTEAPADARDDAAEAVEAAPEARGTDTPRVVPKPGPVPPVPARRRDWRRLRVAAGWIGSTYGDPDHWQNAFGAAIHVRPVRRLELGIAYDGALPARIVTADAELVLRRHQVVLTVGYVGTVYRRVDLELVAVGGLEAQSREASSNVVAVGPDRRFLLAVFGARGRLAVRLVGELRALAEVGVDGIVAHVDQVIVPPGSDMRRVLLDAWPARVRVGAGLAYAFF
jgi:hypothetical protein